MKNPLKIKVLFAVAVVYAMVAGGFLSAPNLPAVEADAPEAVSMQHEVSFTSHYFSDFALHESGVSILSTTPVYSFAKQWEVFKAVIHVSEVRVLQELAQTVAEIIHFPVRIRKADLLFPFHYFF